MNAIVKTAKSPPSKFNLENRISDLPFAAKMLMPSGLAIFLLVAVSGAGGLVMSTQSATIKDLATTQMTRVQTLGAIEAEIKEINASLYQSLTEQAGGQSGAAARVVELASRIDALKARIADMRESELDPAVAEAFTKLETDLDTFKGVIDFVGSMMEIDFASAVSFLGPLQESYVSMEETTTTIIASALESAQDHSDASARQAGLAMSLLIGLAAAAALAAALFAWYVARSTGRSISRIADVTRSLAEGDLDADASALVRKDELGSVVDGLAVFRANAIEMRKQSLQIENLRTETERKLNEVIGTVVHAAGAGDFSKRAPEDQSLGGFLPIAQGLNSICAAAEGFLEEVERQAEALAAGDLTRRIDAPFQGRFKSVADNLSNAGVALAESERKRLEAESDIERAREEQARAASEAVREKAEREQNEVVSALASALTELAHGNLTYRLDAQFAGKYVQLREDFNKAIERLEEAMQAVMVNARAIDVGAAEVSQAADDLAGRTERQASALEQSASMLSRVTDAVNKTAEGSKLANETVVSARQEAVHSGEIVNEAVTAMGAIDNSARQISQITGVIDEIAFQTNLLALNAGVEAARAGDAGRGFAVVASEVRALAQRSAEAAKEIKALISVSANQVASGVKLVGETGEALQRIIARVNDISSHVGEIAASAKEQAQSLGQINMAVSQMDQTTQQNSAMVEESTAAIHSLANETKELTAQVSRFRIGQEPDAPVSYARPAKPGGQSVAAQQSRVAALVNSRGKTRSAAALKSQSSAAEDWDEF